MAARSRVELFEAIRRDARREGLSVRALARRHGTHRRTVRRALASAVPPPRRAPVRAAPKLDPARVLIDGMLRADLDAPRKQRHTARRVWARLVDEHQMSGLSYSTVRDYVARRRPEILAEAGRTVREAFVPQSYEPGAQAEVDFADLWIDLVGVRTRVFLFTLRLSYSGRAVHRVFATQGQEAFLEGHVYAFSRLGGVPADKIRYAKLKSAVSRVLFGRNRVESARWVAFRSTYGFDAFYCRPGREGAHEKGGVEGEGGRFRRTHLVPVPAVASLAELNARLAAADDVDDARRIGARMMSVGHDFAVERPALRPLPAEPFDVALHLSPRVDRYAQISVRQCLYSVPARLSGRRVSVALSASEVVVFDGRVEVARHERATARGSRSLQLDHYLEVLKVKPGALPGATALTQARGAGAFTAAHDAFWAAARARLGDAGGTRALIEVLLLHRQLPPADVVAGIEAALAVGASGPDVVAVEARRAADARAAGDRPSPPPGPPPAAAEVVSLTERRLRELPPDTRPLPSVAGYDQLLHHPGHDGPSGGDGTNDGAGAAADGSRR
ncbi:MAG TPA: IS21 family transposase [Mycobacteriales bacterium]|nr:IS21 family transposase [Mycobacteriales bacterium]